MNYEGILKRIENTGVNPYDINDDPMFKHLILSEEEFENINNDLGIDTFAFKNGIDFISVRYNGEIDFIHYTSIDNKESIEEKGLIQIDNQWIMDLGRGTYVIEDNDDVAEDNLYTYFEEKDDDDEVLKIEGVYKGEYIKCEYGIGHEGYIVISNNIPPSDIFCEETTYGEEFFNF